MAISLGTIYAELGLRMDKFERGVEQAEKQIKQTERRFSEAALGASAAVTGLLAVIGAAASAGAASAIKIAASWEQTEIAFVTMLGSAEKAKAFLADLDRFAAATPFEMPGLVQASRQLLAFGIESQEVIPTLRRIGDIAAGIGAPVKEIAELYGRARVQGRLFAQDVNQLTGRGIPIIGALAKKFGVAESGVRELVESGQIDFRHLEQAFISLSAEGSRFGGLMEAQSKTLIGRWSTAKDQMSLIMRGLGAYLREALNLDPLLDRIGAALGRVADRIREAENAADGFRKIIYEAFPPGIRIAVLGLAGAIAGALVPAFMSAVKWIVATTVALAPLMLKGAAVALAAYAIYRAWEDAGRGMAVVSVMMIRIVGAITGALGFLIPPLRGVSKNMFAYADSLAAAARASRPIAGIVPKIKETQKAQESVSKSGEDAAKSQEELGDAVEEAAKKSGKNIMAFDQVHQLQEETADAGKEAAKAMKMPEIAVPEIQDMPTVPDIEQDLGPLAALATSWDKVNEAMLRAKPTLEKVGQIISGVLIYKITKLIAKKILLGTTALAEAGKVALAWGMKATAAVGSAAIQIGKFILLIGKWTALGASAVTNVAKVAGAWLLQKTKALLSLAAQMPTFVTLLGKWAALGLAAALNAGKVAAAWLLQKTKALISLAGQLPNFIALIAKWAALGLAAALSAGKVVGAWLIMKTKAAISLAGQLPTFAALIGKWAKLGLAATINAAKVAAAWIIALGPKAWIIAAIVGLVAVIVTNWETIRKTTIDVFGEVRNFLDRTWENIKTLADDLWKSVKGTFSDAWKWIEETFGGIGEWFGDIWENVSIAVGEGVQKVIDWFNSLPEKAKLALGNLRIKIEEKLNAVVEFFAGLPETIGPALYEFFTVTLPYNVGLGIGTFVRVIWEGIQEVIEFFSELPGKVGEFLTELYEDLKVWVEDAWLVMTTWAFDVINDVANFFAELPGKVWDWLEDVVEDIVTWGTNMITTVRTEVPKIITAIVNFFAELPGKVWRWLTRAVNDIVTWGANMIRTIRIEVPKVITAIVNFFAELPRRVWRWLEDVVEDITKWGTDLWLEARKSARRLWDGFIDIVDGLPAEVSKILGRVVTRLSNIGSTLWDAAKTAASNLWKGFQRGLGIKSPSYIEEAMQNILNKSDQMVRDMRHNYDVLARMPMPAGITMSPEIQPVARYKAPLDQQVGADTIGQAVYSAMRDAMYIKHFGNQEQQPQEIVLEVDGVRIGRIILPTLVREAQRLGMPILRIAPEV